MSQATKTISQPHYIGQVDQFCRTIGATAIPGGTLSQNDGAGAAIPFLDSTFETPTGSLLGFAAVDYEASATGRFLFKRHTPWLAPYAKTGDVPTVAELGKSISVQDNQTVKKTIAANGLVVTLLEIRNDGYLVMLP